MSMKKFMHARNIYKTPPNFKQLAIDYPEFRKYVKQELSGKVTFDFKNTEALRCLSQTLLKKDFDLEVEMPLNKLIPTIPLRLNYILWVEDLLEISGQTDNIKGIDIGTGASCVYPLLGHKKNGWHMLATEIDPQSAEIASKNVQRNNFTDNIQVIKVKGDCILANVVLSEEYDFCMCNPPFFASKEDTKFQFKSRKESRPRPKNAFCATTTEVIATGGEVEFISRIIKESEQLQQKIRIYTTMVGHKTSLAPLKKLLRDIDVISFKQSEFCQGNTTRWGLAWTFWDIDLRKVPETTLAIQRKQKIKSPFSYVINPPPEDTTVSDVTNKISKIFKELEIEYNKLKERQNVCALHIVATRDTWSHQRRKRRENQRVLNSSDETEPLKSSDSSSSNNIESTTELIAEMQVKSPMKRELEDDDGYYNCKRIKVDEEVIRESVPYLEGNILIRKDAKGLHMEMFWERGSANRDVLHQVLQFIKNNLKL